jgi:hypothetical protein
VVRFHLGSTGQNSITPAISPTFRGLKKLFSKKSKNFPKTPCKKKKKKMYNRIAYELPAGWVAFFSIQVPAGGHSLSTHSYSEVFK